MEYNEGENVAEGKDPGENNYPIPQIFYSLNLQKNSASGIIIFCDPECSEILPSGSWLFNHAAEGKNLFVHIDKTTDQSFLFITMYFSAMPDHGFYGPFP